MARIYKIEGLWIPETIEEAKQIIPTIDEEQFRKWRQDGAVELRVVEVFEGGIYCAVPTAVFCDFTEGAVVKSVKPSPLSKFELTVRIGREAGEETVAKRVFAIEGRAIPTRKFARILLSYTKIIADSLAELHGVEDLVLDEEKFGSEQVAKLLEGETVTIPPESFVADEDVVHVEVEVKYLGTTLGWLLSPASFYILKLQEVNVPPDLLPTDVEFRSSFHRCGWIGKVTNIDPGYRGHIYVLLTPAHNAPELVIEQGARIIQIRFLKLIESLEGYKGQWQEK